MCRTTLVSLDQFPLDVTKCGYNFGVVEVEIIPFFCHVQLQNVIKIPLKRETIALVFM